MRSETAPWWRQATADLETAEIVLQAERFYAVTLFVQQAVGKGLKALYIERTGVLARRTHDLIYLGQTVSVPPAVEADLALLSPAFDVARYPDLSQGTVSADDVTENDATRDVAVARRIFQWLGQELSRA